MNTKERQFNRFIIIICFILINGFITLSLSTIPESYAWFSDTAVSKGKIVNASTTDLLKINKEGLMHYRDGSFNTNISIKNISEVVIPLKVQLISNHQILGSLAVKLEQNKEFFPKINITEKSVISKKLEVKIIGFEGYINELIPVQIGGGTFVKEDLSQLP